MLTQLAFCRVSRSDRMDRFIAMLVAVSLWSFIAPTARAAAQAADDNSGKTWAGIGWGIGVAADFDLGGKRVTDAVIDTVPGGSIVRVTNTSGNVNVSFVLEAHYFLKDALFNFAPGPGQCKAGKVINLNCTEVANGPFIAIEINGGNTASTAAGPITGYALGWMIGLHHPSASVTSSWNFGIGLRVDPAAKVFGDGVIANQAPPPGVTTADQLFKLEPRYGIMLLSSFSF